MIVVEANVVAEDDAVMAEGHLIQFNPQFSIKLS